VIVELVLGVPVLMLLLWFLVYCGRMSDARLRVEDAAHQAARAATLARTTSAARADARTTAAASLTDAGVTCRSFAVTATGTLAPGSTVTATVTCTVDLHDLALLDVPGTTKLTAHFTAQVDVYRSTTVTSPTGATP
jgi:Flp pilus assembly protein TadG